MADELRLDGCDLIANERERQVEQEGWTPEHDDEHDGSDLVRAATAYAYASFIDYRPYNSVPRAWPWAAEWWKPSPDPIRNLVKAGALIAAEIDRLQRKVQG